MGRHSAFVESSVVRDDWGRFGEENHSAAPASPVPAAPSAPSTSQRGMPDSIATSTIKLSNGSSLDVGRTPDGGLILTGDHGVTAFNQPAAKNLLKSLSLAGDMDAGDEEVVKHTENRNGSGYTTLTGMIEKTGSDSYQVRLADDDPSYDELADSPGLNLNGKDLDRISSTQERLDAATRVDTGYGDADVLLTDDNGFAFRHLDDNGRPVEAKFDSKSFAKINRAMSVVFEGFDEMEDFVKGDAADDVTSIDIPTNAGKVRVERLGEWGGNGPGDRLRIMPVDSDDWGIVVDGPQQDAWADAMSNAAEYGSALGFHKPM